MIDETKKGMKKSNKVKKERKRSVLGRISAIFMATLHFLNQKINLSIRLFSNMKDSFSFKHFSSGYVLILSVIALPVLLYGAKYLLDHRTLLDHKVAYSPSEGKVLVKFCANEAARAVAAKWNPALTYKQQREAMLRIADEIYNAAPTYEASPVTQALHGIDILKEVTNKGGAYDPIKVTLALDEGVSSSSSLKQIARTTRTTDMRRYYFYYYYSTRQAPMALYHFDIMYQSLIRENVNLFSPDEDLYEDYVYYCSNDSNPSGSSWYHYVTWPQVVDMSTKDGASSVRTKSYTTRTDLDDETVKIEIEDDMIKVTTDDDVAYAVPEECNVDIILTVPTNSAALNPDNLDKNTPTQGTPYISTSTTSTDEAKSTPIYQITRAYQKFLKDNFFYTRGVNVGVIPYSGKVSLRGDRSAWVKTPDRFVPNYFLDGSFPPMIMGSMMYGTEGTAGANLTATGTYGGYEYGYGLLCRGETQSYNGNTITLGDVLSTEDPSSYKFRKMVYNPCYAGYANLLSMKCEKTGNKHWMNPYFILELNPDVKFIYNMLGAFYPYYDDRNVSNFVFIPVTWANNLLQSWSATGENEAVDTSDDSTNLGRLSTPSKTTSGRKKALILIVNKPDWFEPGELTYLGFDNDYSEIPMYESDCIGGDIDYSDTTQKFADGSRYDGTIQGAKKILKLEKVSGDDLVRMNGFYECSNGIYRLKFPKKQTVKLQVARGTGKKQVKFVALSHYGDVAFSGDGINWESSHLPSSPGTSWFSVCYGNGKFVAVGYKDDKVAYSEDGIVWEFATLPVSGKWESVCYGDGKFVAVSYGGNDTYGGTDAAYSEDGINWNSAILPFGYWEAVCYGDGKFIAVSYSSNYAAYSEDGINWRSVTIPNAYWRSVCYGNGKFVAVSYYDAKAAYSFNGIDWQSTNLSFSDYSNSVSYGDGKFVAVNLITDDASYSEDGIVWKPINTMPSADGWYTTCYGDGKFVATPRYSHMSAYSYDGINWERGGNLPSYIYWEAVCYRSSDSASSPSPGSLQFTSSSVLSDTEKKTITTEETFVITPDKIEGGSDGAYFIEFEMKNIKLISAEITNRPLPDANSITATYVNNVKYISESDSIVFSASRTQGDNAYLRYEDFEGSTTYDDDLGRISDGTVKGRLYFPHKGRVTLTVDNLGDPQNIKWTRQTSCVDHNGNSMTMPTNDLFCVKSLDDGKIWAVGGSGTMLWSSDAETWHYLGSSDRDDGWTEDIVGICYGNGKYVAAAKGARILYRNDDSNDHGRTWYKTSDNFSRSANCSVFGSVSGIDTFVVGMDDGRVSYRTGESDRWEEYGTVFGDYTYFRDGIFADDKFVIVGPGGYFVYSSNGKDWGKKEINLGAELPGITYGNGKYVACGGWGYIVTGDNSISNVSASQPSEIGSSHWLYGIAYGGGIFLTVDENGFVFSSSDAVTWTGLTKKIVPYSVRLSHNHLAYSERLKKFIAVGNSGEIYTAYYREYASTIKFSSSTVSEHNNTETINSQKTYTFTPDQILGGSEGNYYIEFDMTDVKMISASYSYSSVEADGTTTESVYDVIDFANGLNGKNGIMSASSGWNGSVSNGLYVVNVIDSEPTARITTSKEGKIHLVVAPATQLVDGLIRYYPNWSIDPSRRTISSKTTITIEVRDMVPSGSSYYVDIGARNVVILSAKWEPVTEKLQLPKRSRYIDYSQDPLNCYQTSTDNRFFDSWEYNENNGHWTNINNSGDWSALYLNDTGDYTAIAYGDKQYEAIRYHLNGTSSDGTYGKYDTFKTAGLNRIFTDWENRTDSVKNYGFMWSKYRNKNPGSLYWMIGALTSPINASFWKPINEYWDFTVDYGNHYQFDQEGNYNYTDATKAAAKITSNACYKLKDDYMGKNLSIYVIKYRKQTKYKTEMGVESDYSYDSIDSCASYRREPYLYDVSTTDELNNALKNIAQHIKQEVPDHPIAW